jgi:lamin tail-like protein
VLLIRSWRGRRRQSPPRGAHLSPGDWINLGLLVLGVAGAVAGIVHCPDQPPVGISLADSRLNPAGYDDPSDEYVCLVSSADQPVSLAGWELRAAERRINVLPNLTLQPEATVRVHPGEGSNSTDDLFGEKGSAQWRNEGGQISLVDSEGEEVAAVGYGERKDGDGSGECGPEKELSLTITSPSQEATVESGSITIAGTVTPGSVVRAKLDHDDESDAGGEVARVQSGDGVDRFTVDVKLESGENHVRVWAEQPGAEPAYAGVVVTWEGTERTSTAEPPPPPPPPRCDPNYKGACLDPEASDYDCTGGEGDGPEYVEGPIAIVGEDHFDLDGDGDGIACEP